MNALQHCRQVAWAEASLSWIAQCPTPAAGPADSERGPGADFRTHCTLVVNLRCQELNLPLCRLAMFLDPRYRGHVDDGHGLDALVTTVPALHPATQLCLSWL